VVEMKCVLGMLRRLTKRPWSFLVIALVIGGGIALGLLLARGDGTTQQRGLGATVQVARGDIAQTVIAYGNVVPKREYTFTFAGSRIEELLVSVGDRVTEGQVLVRLDSTQEELALLQAERSLAEAQAQGVPAIIREKELAYNLAKANLENTAIRAQFPGIVTEIKQATTATENWSLTLIDTSELFIEVTVDQLDVPSLREGQRAVAVIEALPDRTWPVEVVKIGGRAVTRGTTTVVSVTARLLAADPSILVGYTARVEITIASATNVLRVPVSALVQAGRGWSVMKVASGQVVAQPVTIGVRSDLWAEIRSGVDEGDVILLNPSTATSTTTNQNLIQPTPGFMMPPGGP
jgi:HlyD family secretion protein